MAEQHVVGGSQGWDESTDFNSWVSGRTFMVGDQRVFKYSSLHSVVELGSESEYKNCNIGNAVNSMSSGNDVCEIEQAYHTLLCMWYNGSLRSRHEEVNGDADFAVGADSEGGVKVQYPLQGRGLLEEKELQGWPATII
ncbi:hypothetical protein JHK87_044341 [Glycine soja]|nr:hypothetical protein JHK87_044341 [Glycine soja]